MRRFFVYALPLVVAAFAPAAAQGPTRDVTGTVTQVGTGAPLADVTVGVLGQPAGVRTNERGEYRIRVPGGDVTLQVRAIGYKRVSQRVPSGSATQNFQLEKDVLQLEGVTITGAATTVEKRNAATAVASVSSVDLTRVPAKSVEGALQGKVIGASINLNNGAPGGGGQVQIRGASSLIGRIDPLFVLDGVIISNATRSNRQSAVTGSLNSAEENTTNRLADLNPNDIESIEVLKGAAASAIYGSQATNGVVVITTKRPQGGAPRFDFTQRLGYYETIRNPGSRVFDNLDEVLATIGDNKEGIAAAKSVCTPSCPHHDYVAELFGRTKPSYETMASFSGGSSTKYYASVRDAEESGTAIGTGARRQSLHATIDQTLGSKITVSAGANTFHSFSQRGISNNDNAFTSPLYGFAYTPGILDLRQKDANGTYVRNPFAGGGTLGGSNPFETFDIMQNNEDVWRMIVTGRGNYAAYSDAHNTLNLSVVGGVDRFSNENYIWAPQNLQFELPGTQRGGTFPGHVIQGNGTNRNSNVTGSAVWTFTPGGVLSATTSGGLQFEEQMGNDYNLQGRGLGPQQQVVAGAQNITVTNSRSLIRNQAWYAQEEMLLFGERLYISGAVRGERSSVNGDPDKLYYFPRGAVSYRFASPVRGVDEVKLRASYGQSGNRPGYGDRFLTISNVGQIGGVTGYGLPGTLGNPAIKPERLNEREIGVDAGFLRDRVRLEATHYNRKITDLLVRPTLAPSSGVTGTTINGGEMEAKGYELGLTLVPVQMRDVTWTSRATWFQNRADITKFPPGVNAFATGTAAGGFGNAFGRLFYSPGHSVTTIWGNKVVDGKTVPNTPLAESNPKYIMSFTQDVSYKALSLNVLVDYRRGGAVSNMTLNLFDEGGTTWDYDQPSPDPKVGKTLGEYRYNKWAGGADAGAYLMDGSYTKIREVNVSLAVPGRFVTRIPGAKSARLSLAGRNLFIISGYNGFDPEVNNGGALVPGRFVDLAPFPPNRSIFFSLDLGF